MLLFGRGFFFLSLGTTWLCFRPIGPVSLKSCPLWFVFVYVLMVCVFVTRDTVHHPRRFVFGKFVCKPNCSWSEAFVNRGLTVPGSHSVISGTYSGLTMTCGRARNESNSFCRLIYSTAFSFPSSRNVPSWFRNNSITQMTIIVICVLSWGFRPSNFCNDNQLVCRKQNGTPWFISTPHYWLADSLFTLWPWSWTFTV